MSYRGYDNGIGAMNPIDVTLPTPASEKRADERLTYDVPEAGRLLGLSRNSAYAAAKAGLIPVLNVGRRMLVPKAALHEMLSIGGAKWQRAREATAKSEADQRQRAKAAEGGEGEPET
jgi:excisionase family DNA binding protein